MSGVTKKPDTKFPSHPLGRGAGKTACLSLEPQKKAPCAKVRAPLPRRRTCPAMEPEPQPEPPPCMREEPKVSKPLKKRSNSDGDRCKPCRVVKVPCGIPGQEGSSMGGLQAKIFALEKTLSKTQWHDEEGYHSASVTMSQIYRPEDPLASAAPEPMSNVVVPLSVQGRKPPSLDLPNPDKMVQRACGVAAPNPSVFQESETYESFTEHLQEDIAARSPAVADVSGYLGAPLALSSTVESESLNAHSEEGILEYIIRPEPPSYRNRVRLNGSVRPSWFPGYVVVSPLIPDCARLSHNPGDALRDAWCLCRPQHFDDLSKSLVNTE